MNQRVRLVNGLVCANDLTFINIKKKKQTNAALIYGRSSFQGDFLWPGTPVVCHLSSVHSVWVGTSVLLDLAQDPPGQHTGSTPSIPFTAVMDP